MNFLSRGRLPFRHKANMNFLSSFLWESEKGTASDLASMPCAERCLPITLTWETVQRGTKSGWNCDTSHVIAVAAGVHHAYWEGKAATHIDPCQLCVTAWRWGGPVKLTHAHQHTINWQPCPEISWMLLKCLYLKRRHLLWRYFS